MRPLFWRVVPAALPVWLRACRHCAHGELVPTNRFRVNSHGALHDVWLLYECGRCAAPTKRALLRRVREHGPSLAPYRENDAGAAALWSLHLDRGRALDYEVVGPAPQGPGCWRVRVDQPFPCRARWDQLLARALGVSRSRVRAAWGAGLVPVSDVSRPRDLVSAAAVLVVRLDGTGSPALRADLS